MSDTPTWRCQRATSASCRCLDAAPLSFWRLSSIAQSRVAHVRVLDELDHLPVGDEIPLGLRRVGEEPAGDRQLAPIGTRRLLGDPGAVDPPLSNQTYR